MTLLKIPTLDSVLNSRLPPSEPKCSYINIALIERVEQFDGYFKLFYKDSMAVLRGDFEGCFSSGLQDEIKIYGRKEK